MGGNTCLLGGKDLHEVAKKIGEYAKSSEKFGLYVDDFEIFTDENAYVFAFMRMKKRL